MLLMILAGLIGYGADDSAKQIEFLRSSYKANKDAFAYGSFRFEFTRGSSKSSADAESEVFAWAFREDGFFVFDGENARYELLADPKVLAAATKRIDERHSTSFITAFRSLTDGTFTLLDNLQPVERNTALRHGAIIHPGTYLFYRSGSFSFPLYLGDKGKGGADHDLFRDLTALKDGKVSLAELDMDSRLGDRKVCRFSFTRKDGTCTYWIDLDRGSVPLRIHDHYNPNNQDTTYIFSDLEHVANAGWLPRRRLHFFAQGQIVDRVIVTEIDTWNKPQPSVFQLDYPEPIILFDDARKLVYPRRKSWSLLDLPDPASPGVKPVMPRP